MSSNSTDLQKALNIVENWSSTWNLQIQPSKSEHISFNYPKSSSSKDYFLNKLPIPHSENVKDLGLILSQNFKWSNYISNITAKASITSFSILRAFKFSRPSILINLYKTHVRPKLEYNSPIWNPCLIKEITCIENVQRKFTKRLLQRNNISFENYQDRLKILNLETLEKRRIKFDLILMYKIQFQFNLFFIFIHTTHKQNTKKLN